MAKTSHWLGDLIFPLALVVLVGLHFWFAVKTQAYFSLDDFAVLAYFKTHSVGEMIRQFLTTGDIWGFRKILGYLLLRLVYLNAGVWAGAYLITNHFLATINVLLVYLLVRRLSGGKFRAFFAALVFNASYLVYFSNVHEYLVTTMSLISLYGFIVKRYSWSLIFFFMALLSKEVGMGVVAGVAAVIYYQKRPWRQLLPYLVLATIDFLYQGSFAASRLAVLPDHPYATSLQPRIWWENLKFYLPVSWMLILVLSLPWGKQKRVWPFIFVGLIALAPALILKNRQETYYWYLPSAYFAIYLGLILPKLKQETSICYLVIFILLGGRKLLPPLARQEYPNWQKASIEQVLQQTKTTLATNPQAKKISFTNLVLERDAKLMLGSGVVDLFLPATVSAQYRFSYNHAQNELEVEAN